MRTIITLLSLSAFCICQAQLTIANPSFEEMSSCPGLLSQIELATGWHDVVESSDYYNCGFTSELFPTGSGASDGTGYVDFASYGNENGASEAIGQNFDVDLLAGSYPLAIDVKRANAGSYMSDCGGVAIYGLPDVLPGFATNIHASELTGAVLLATTALVDNVEWEQRNVTLIVPSTLRSIVFTTALTPNCPEAIFIDNIRTHVGPTSVNDVDSNEAMALYPNPVMDQVNIDQHTAQLAHWNLLDAAGRVQRTGVFNDMHNSVDLSSLEAGSYIFRWSTNDGVEHARTLVKAVR